MNRVLVRIFTSVLILCLMLTSLPVNVLASEFIAPTTEAEQHIEVLETTSEESVELPVETETIESVVEELPEVDLFACSDLESAFPMINVYTSSDSAIEEPSAEEPTPLATKITLSETSIKIKKSKSVALPEVTLDGAGTIEWAVSDSTIASIDDDITKLTGHKYGDILLFAFLKEDDSVYAVADISVVPNNAGLKVYTGSISSRFKSLKKQFPHGKYWNNCSYKNTFDPNTYSSTACSKSDHKKFKRCGYFGNGIQCLGFADRIAYGLFGSYPDYFVNKGQMDSNGWVCTSNKKVVNYLEPGDWVRIKHSNGEHSFVVWKISGNNVYCVEANWSGRCMIQWGKVRTKSQIKSNLLYVWKNPESKYKEKFLAGSKAKEIEITYTVDNDQAYIVNANFNYSTEWIIPDTYEGYPVVGFSENFECKKYTKLETIQLGNNFIIPEDYSEDYVNSWPYEFYEVKAVTISDTNNKYISLDGVVYSKDMKVLHLYPTGKRDTFFSIPEGVEGINYSFSDWDNYYLTHLHFPASFKYADSIHLDFCNLYCLESVTIDPANPYYTSSNGALLSKDGKHLYFLPEGLDSWAMPEGLEYADEQWLSLENLTIPSSVKSARLYGDDWGGYTFKTIILDGCDLTAYDNSLAVESIVFLNDAQLTLETSEDMSSDDGFLCKKVYAEEGSFGEAFAEEYGIKFVKLQLSVAPAEVKLYPTRSKSLAVSMPYLNSLKQPIIWESSDPAIATVSRSGKVTGVSYGTATITATVRGQNISGMSTVTVVPCKPKKVYLDYSGTVKVDLGTTLKLTPSLSPSYADTTYKWTSSKKSVATVSDGIVTPVKVGTCTIKVTTKNKKTDYVKIKVVDPTIPTSVKLYQGETKLSSKKTLRLSLDDTLTLTPKIAPVTAIENYTWKSSNKKIATVADGVITPVKPGTATITIRTHNGKSASVNIKVFDPLIPTGVSLYNGETKLTSSTTVRLGLDATLALTPQIAPVTAIENYTWKSSDKKIATVADGVITPIKPGTVTITVKTHNGKSASVKVKVFDPLVPTKVTLYNGETKLSKSSVVKLKLGETLTLTPKISPSTAIENYTWKSSSKSIAKVSGGVVTPVKVGTATITVKTHNGKSTYVKVKVVKGS